MSVKYMSQVWLDPCIHEKNELIVLLALADWADDDGCCWPGIAKLASKTRLSERGLQYILERLRKSGHLCIERGGLFGTGTNTYHLSCPRGAPAAPPPNRGAIALHPGGAKYVERGCNSFAPYTSVHVNDTSRVASLPFSAFKEKAEQKDKGSQGTIRELPSHLNTARM